MKTIIPIGGAGIRIANKLQEINKAYSVYRIDYDKLSQPDFHFEIPPKTEEEKLESLFPAQELKNSFPLSNPVPRGFIVAGGGKISSIALRVLETLSGKSSCLLYYVPDSEFLSSKMKILEKVTFNVLQEYARSAIIDRIYLLYGRQIEQHLQNVSYAQYYPKINETIAHTFNMINLLSYQEPVFETHDPEGLIQPARISTIGTVDLDNGAECLFYPLEMPREKIYYFLVGKEQLQRDTELMTKIRTFIRNKMSPQVDVTYRIYESPYDGVNAYCVWNASMIQNQTFGP